MPILIRSINEAPIDMMVEICGDTRLYIDFLPRLSNLEVILLTNNITQIARLRDYVQSELGFTIDIIPLDGVPIESKLHSTYGFPPRLSLQRQ